ncbi:hypothetical protein [Hymenobacter terrenus]|uniref:hypothetical protein n=1 Tax=Hymenobacter terrenus TaxID=1629124 RepID=UPI000619FAC1|nr:hypothetical protein [Hymenobacter terrenus]
MTRLVLVLLLLANYLLVLGAGLVNRPDPAGSHAEHPYVHSADCQQRNYLRLDCFESCTGKPSVKKKLPASSLAHLVAQAKGIDAHCLPDAAPDPMVRVRYLAKRRAAAWQPALLSGVRRLIKSPPRLA